MKHYSYQLCGGIVYKIVSINLLRVKVWQIAIVARFFFSPERKIYVCNSALKQINNTFFKVTIHSAINYILIT